MLYDNNVNKQTDIGQDKKEKKEIKQLHAPSRGSVCVYARKVNRANAHAYTHTSRYHYPSGMPRARREIEIEFPFCLLRFNGILYKIYYLFLTPTGCCCCCCCCACLLRSSLLLSLVSSAIGNFRLRDEEDDDDDEMSPD